MLLPISTNNQHVAIEDALGQFISPQCRWKFYRVINREDAVFVQLERRPQLTSTNVYNMSCLYMLYAMMTCPATMPRHATFHVMSHSMSCHATFHVMPHSMSCHIPCHDCSHHVMSDRFLKTSMLTDWVMVLEISQGSVIISLRAMGQVQPMVEVCLLNLMKPLHNSWLASVSP